MEPLISVNVGKYKVEGITIAGYYSFVMIENLNICFDLGIGSRATAKYSTVLITHGHHDHCGGLYRHNHHRRVRKSHKENISQAVYVVPPVCLSGIRQMYLGFYNLDTGTNCAQKVHPNYVALEPGNDHWISKDIFTRPFATKHRVPSQGYTVYQRRKKLKPEYMQLQGNKIRDLRLTGVDVTEDVDFPLVSYTGDTVIEGIFTHVDVMASELLIMECTILDDALSVQETRNRGHVHLDELLKHAKKFKDIPDILLCHFSDRYRPEEIRHIITKRLKGTVLESNVNIFCAKKKKQIKKKIMK